MKSLGRSPSNWARQTCFHLSFQMYHMFLFRQKKKKPFFQNLAGVQPASSFLSLEIKETSFNRVSTKSSLLKGTISMQTLSFFPAIAGVDKRTTFKGPLVISSITQTLPESELMT